MSGIQPTYTLVPSLAGSSMAAPLLRRGSRGPEVASLQRAIGVTPDGIFGRQTERAVRDYQRGHGLSPDGLAGLHTRTSLFGSPNPLPTPEPLLRRGSRGTDVSGLQRSLGITPDGIFGRQTERAVRALQQRSGLRVDGLVGNRTRKALFGAGATPSPVAPTPGPAGSTDWSVRYSVVPTFKPSKLDLCPQVSMTMLAQYQRDRQLALGGPQTRPTGLAWESLLKPETQREIQSMGQSFLHVGTRLPKVAAEAKKYGFSMTSLAGTPAAFRTALETKGPFLYVGKTRHRNLLGQRYGHGVAVTGVEQRGDMHYVHYNDPADGQAHCDEFYGFLRRLMPIHQGATSPAFHVAQPWSRSSTSGQ